MSIGRFFSNICGFGPFHNQLTVADYDAVIRRQMKMLSTQGERKAKVYDGIGHIAILTDQRYGQELHVVEQFNHVVRHARIGKITMKAAA